MRYIVSQRPYIQTWFPRPKRRITGVSLPAVVAAHAALPVGSGFAALLLLLHLHLNLILIHQMPKLLRCPLALPQHCTRALPQSHPVQRWNSDGLLIRYSRTVPGHGPRMRCGCCQAKLAAVHRVTAAVETAFGVTLRPHPTAQEWYLLLRPESRSLTGAGGIG